MYSAAACHNPADLSLGRKAQYSVDRRLSGARSSLDAMARKSPYLQGIKA
jgi:hypothetical protein